MSHQLISALIIAITLAADLYTDLAKYWGRVNHRKGFWLRVPSAIAATIIYWPSLMLWFSYWMLMDSVIGVVKFRNVFAIGSTAWLDRMQHRYPFLIWLKYGTGVGSIILYIWL